MCQTQGDISIMHCANDGDKDEGDGDDLEGGQDEKDNNDDEGDQCGYLPVRSRCSDSVMAPSLPLTVTNDLPLKRVRYTHTPALAHANINIKSLIRWLAAIARHSSGQLAADAGEPLTITPTAPPLTASSRPVNLLHRLVKMSP